jgi:NAD(P)-dependent dehydrogenase (short-subunit alcohol dehydrogenase family)
MDSMIQPEIFARYPSLRDRVVLVTGGGSGIGAAVVEQFARQGARVAFVDLAVEVSNYLVDELSPHCAHAPLFVPCDLTDIAALREALSRIQTSLGPVRVLINNAANDDRHAFSGVTPEYWDHAMAVNLRHQFFAIQAIAPGMTAAGGGSIVNMSSIAWMIPGTGMPAYVSAKAAIVGLTRTMARELGASNIRVNAVLPGAILTERQKRLWWTPEFEAEIKVRQTLKRYLLPEDVARLILFLSADDSAAITGQSHIVDGGWV